MWWIIIALLLFSRKSVAATVAATPTVQTPSGTTTVGSTTPSTPAPFIANPDTIPNAWPGLAVVLSDDPAVNAGLGGAPPSNQNLPAAPPSNSQANIIAMAVPAQEPLIPLQIDPLPMFTTTQTAVLPTKDSFVTVRQTTGLNMPRLEQL
ncbi:MAG TPA: hypothetical protein VGJ33_16240 [Candidatus Angelobacter sp.]|jgi:hypothetical protein